MSVPTSKYFQVPEWEITSYLHGLGLETKVSGNNLQVRVCPFCHDTKGKSDNHWKLGFDRQSGGSNCLRCGWKGSWFDFKKKTGGLPDFQNSQGVSWNERKVYKIPDQEIARCYPTALDLYPDVADYLINKRKLTKATLEFYQVGVQEYKFESDTEKTPDGKPKWVNEACVTFPWIESENGKDFIIKRVKARSVVEKAHMRLDPAGGAWGWFGWHTIPNDAKEICITEGEYDAMSVWQETRIPTISLPNGYKSLPPELIPYLDRFEKIIMCLDDDSFGQDASIAFAKKLGQHRIKNVRMRQGDKNGPKDANEALQKGLSVKSAILHAEPIPHEQIQHLAELRDDITREIINPSQTAGIPFDSLPGLTTILKGHRPGEFTIFTGPSGAGKTSILSQLSLDLAERGVHTLWGSFEIPNMRLAKKMLFQYSKTNLYNNIGHIDKAFDKFQKLPMWFMRFYGTTDVEKILGAMKYAVYALDVKHIIIDNLQFLLSGTQMRGGNKFDMQDDAIAKFRLFASENNVHVTLVIHPKKVGSGVELDSGTLGGTNTANTVCDNLLVLQKGKFYRYLDIQKNRHDGELGQVAYDYDKECQRIFELTPDQIRAKQEEVLSGDFVSGAGVVIKHGNNAPAPQYKRNPGIKNFAPQAAPRSYTEPKQYD